MSLFFSFHESGYVLLLLLLLMSNCFPSWSQSMKDIVSVFPFLETYLVSWYMVNFEKVLCVLRQSMFLYDVAKCSVSFFIGLIGFIVSFTLLYLYLEFVWMIFLLVRMEY